MRYAKIEKNSIANGIGIRCVLWCQGCSVHCKGCHNPQTWCFDGGKDFIVNVIQIKIFLKKNSDLVLTNTLLCIIIYLTINLLKGIFCNT